MILALLTLSALACLFFVISYRNATKGERRYKRLLKEKQRKIADYNQDKQTRLNEFNRKR